MYIAFPVNESKLDDDPVIIPADSSVPFTTVVQNVVLYVEFTSKLNFPFMVAIPSRPDK